MLKGIAHLRGLFLGAAILFLSGPVFSAEQVIGPFSGLNNTDNPATIPPDKSQDLLNVDLSLGGRSVKKREGYGLALTMAITTSPVHGVYTFYDTSGNDVVLVFNDSKMTASINGGSPSTIFSDGPFGATYQCVDSQGFAYCNNTSRSRMIKTNGVTFSTMTLTSTGTMVAVTPDRLVQAGFASTPNRVDFSAAGDFTSWTTGVSPTSAFNFTITAPGSKVTHIAYAFNRILALKDSSFNFIIQGQTAADWVVQTISPQVGTLDNSSVYDKGIFYFRAQDSHIYAYDGSNLQKLTRDIGGTISASQSRASNSYTQTTQADWAAGTYENSVYVDTETISGNLQTLFPDVFNSFRSTGTGIAEMVWSTGTTGGAVSNIAVSAGELVFHGSNSGTTQLIQMRSIQPTQQLSSSGATWYFQIEDMADTSGENDVTVYFIFNDQAFAADTSFSARDNTSSNRMYFLLNSTVTSRNDDYRFTGLKMESGSTTNINMSSSTAMLTSASTVRFWVNSTNFALYVNDILVVTAGLNGFDINKRWYMYVGMLTATSSNVGINLDNYTIVPQTFTYYSPVKNAPNITSWDTFTANYSVALGSHTFFTRASTNTFSVLSSTPSWTAITPGNVPSISTGSFFQVRDDFSAFYSTGGLPLSLSDFTQNWFEGQATDKAYATYFDDAVWWSVASGTGASTNNSVLRLDLLNNAWLLYDIPTNGYYVRNNNLYFGSTTGGYVYKFGDADSDNGSAITAYWKSKDFFSDSPFTDDDITSVSTFFAAVNNSSMTVTYSVNGSTSTSYTVPLYRSNASFGRNNRNLPLGTVGNTFNVKFGNSAADQPFEVFAVQYGITPKSWRPGE